jgi:hypothetical protein
MIGFKGDDVLHVKPNWFRDNASEVLIISMYKKTIRDTNVCLSVQDHIVYHPNFSVQDKQQPQ